jgi:enoyl-CoA hydratase/carnithine racemase
MTDPYVTTERQDGDVVLVQLNRAPMNPLSQAMLAALRDVAHELAADPTVKAVVVTGSERAFAAGADIDEFGDSETARRIGVGFRESLDALAAIPRPVIAAIQGYALGGGLELAMACDFRVASEKARLGQPEILLGIVPGAGATQRLARLVGPARAKALIFGGRQVRADEALAIGLVDKVAVPESVLETALTWARELAAGAVVAIGLAKRAIDEGLGRPLDEGLDLEARAFVEVFDTEDAQVGIASFRAHGPGRARFSGR